MKKTAVFAFAVGYARYLRKSTDSAIRSTTSGKSAFFNIFDHS